MKKRNIIFLSVGMAFASLCISNKSLAQEASKHTVQAGETLTKIAKAYGTTVGDIMRFNGMNTQSKLEVGQSIKIPPAGVHIIGKASSEETTESSTTTKPFIDNGNPQAHTVVAGESLYKISKTYKVSIANIKKWNNLSSDNIHVGQVLQLSANSVATQQSNTANTSTPTEVSETGTSGIIKGNSSATNVNATKTRKSEPVKVVSTETTTLANNNGGAFASGFGQDVENMSLSDVKGKAKIFKSQSGWSDQKFYIMMNDVTPGSIVKVTYNGNSVFAKVLWNLIDTKENAGISFRISDATASTLGINGTDSFDLKVDYYK